MSNQPTNNDIMQLLEKMFDTMNNKFDSLNGKFSEINGQFDQINEKFSQINGKIDNITNDLKRFREETNSRFKAIHGDMSDIKKK